MSNGRSGSRRVTLPDEFPPRPTSMIKNELIRMNSKIEKKETYTLVLLCCTYFFYGLSVGLYGPLYPEQAKSHGVATYIYGPAMSIHYLAALLFYPVACLLIGSVNCNLAISLGIFITGACKLLFGTLSRITEALPFILLSYGIQIVEGIGFGILLATTCIVIFSQITEKSGRNRKIICLFFVLGISVSPICGEAIYTAINFSVPFYGVGTLLCLCALLLGLMLPEPDQRLSIKDIPFISWMKKSRMLIYFLVVFSTFNYIGFLTVTLEPYLRQFHLSKLFHGVLFSIPAFSCGLSAPGWTWVSKKGINSVLLICISGLLIFASLLLIGPPPFIRLDLTLANVSSALLLCGFGTGGKLACVVYTAHRDLGSRQSLNGTQEPLLIPTMFCFGALLGFKLDKGRSQTLENICLQQNNRKMDTPCQKNQKYPVSNPFLKDGYSRLDGRLQFPDISSDTQHPSLLDGNHSSVHHLIQHTHIRLHHLGVCTVLSELRSTLWILKRRQAKKQFHKCLPCKLSKAKCGRQNEAFLPSERVVNFAGPVNIRCWIPRDTAYIALFTCATTRGLHIELVSDLTKDLDFVLPCKSPLAVGAMASTLKDSVLHWRKKLERTDDESVILNVIHKLSKVPVSVDLLQDTGIGKVIRSLAKKSGKVGVKATSVLHNWREVVSSTQKSPDNSSKVVHSKHNSNKAERKEERVDTEKSHKKSTSSHERQSSRDKKSSNSSSKQYPSTNEHSSKNYNNHVLNNTDDSDYASYHHDLNSTFKHSNTDESDAEASSVADSSYSGKRKSFETSPSNTENHASEAKRLKTNLSFSPSDSSHYKNGSEKQSNHSSHKKKDKEKKSHNSGIQSNTKPSHNSHSHNSVSKNSEIEKHVSKKPKKNKDSEKKSHSEVKKALKIKPTESFTSSEARFEDCLNFSDIVPVKKKKSSKTSDKKEKQKENSNKKVGIENSKPRESVSKSSTKLSITSSTTKIPELDKNSLPSLLSDSAQKSLPKISEVDILSTLPQTQPNYRPLPQRNFDSLPSKKKVLTNEDAIKFTSSRKERTSVYSGRKSLFYTEMPTLFECASMCFLYYAALNVLSIEYLGEVPYFLLKPVLERCTPLQLYNIEDYNPYLLDDTHELWEAHCKRDFRTVNLQENETWRELYLRAFEERERKLKSLTANISASMSKSGPARQVKLAYVNTVAKPPRDVARKQAKMGTALPVNHTVKAGPSSKASPRPSAPAINSAASSSRASEHSIPKKPKIAPLMAKTLKTLTSI
ncbi:Elongin-A like protein [Argiope bruennichi]|uniref:Elongin-A like protein n=1 Tax=Argiope bruennichi TaxID=94029 RepID=A0A8T0FP53_ARGBR|nr:Elongin-A like protein [Argiope bruennichi]